MAAPQLRHVTALRVGSGGGRGVAQGGAGSSDTSSVPGSGGSGSISPPSPVPPTGPGISLHTLLPCALPREL